MEFALNLVCLLIGCGSLLTWTVWRCRSDSTLVLDLIRGLFIIGLVLMLFLPAVSITDDLAQSPSFAECVKLRDALKVPEHFVQFLVAFIFALSLSSAGRVVLCRETSGAQASLQKLSCWTPNIEKRPPPQPAT